MERLRTLIAGWQANFSTLSERERRLVALAATAVLAFVVFMVTFTFNGKANSIRARTAQKLSKLADVQELAQSFREAEGKRQAVEAQLQASNIRLISYLEEKGQKAGLDIPTLNPKPDTNLSGDKIVESAVELTLTDVKLGRLVDFLQAVESGPGVVKVKYLRLEPRPASETVTAWVLVAAYHPKG